MFISNFHNDHPLDLYYCFENKLLHLKMIFQWTTTLLVNYYVFRDEDFLARKTYPGGTSENSAPKLLKMHFLVLFFDLATTLGDMGLYRINKKQKNSRVMDYSLSKSYQLNENTAALKLLLPLSLCHSIFFLLYLLLNVSAREFGNNLNHVEFMASLEGTYVVISCLQFYKRFNFVFS